MGIPERKIIWHMHSSLDGFAAGPNGEMNWINIDEEIFDDGHTWTESADVALYGRGTYALMEPYWPTAAQKPGASRHEIAHGNWANAAQKFVFSRTLEKVTWAGVTIVRDDIPGLIQRLRQEPGKNMVMFGSPGLATSFMNLGLIDEYRVNLNPVFLGHGKRILGDVTKVMGMKLVDQKTYSSGVIALHYIRK
jgi:dihydrofolate reductase